MGGLNLQFPERSLQREAWKIEELAVRGDGMIAKSAEDSCYTLPFELDVSGTKRVQFAVAWYAPIWKDSGDEPRTHRYAQRFKSAAEVAEFGLKNRESLLRRALAWQSEIYKTDLPEWLRDALVQAFYSYAKNSAWVAKVRKDDWWGGNGWFAHSESNFGCPIIDSMVCRIHGHFPLLFFFSELEETTLDAFRFLYTLDDDDCGLVHDHPHVVQGRPWPANQFYDLWPWQGTSAHVAGTWLATLTAGVALAEAAGDGAFASECRSRLSKARLSFEKNLWNGSYYRLWSDTATGKTNEASLGNQLMAVWCTRVAGLQDVLPAAHIHSALDTVEKLNMGATAYGLINGVNPDGRPATTGNEEADVHSINIFFGENLCAAMTFAYYGSKDT